MEDLATSQKLLRAIKILLVLSIAAWGIFGALGNLLDWPGTYGAVLAVTQMQQFEGGAGDWRSTSSPLVVGAGASFIVAFKSTTALLALIGTFAMWRSLSGTAAEFGRAKAWGIAASMVAVFGLFSGWIVIGEGWYEFWRDRGLDGLEGAGFAAFRYGGFIGLIGLLVASREP